MNRLIPLFSALLFSWYISGCSSAPEKEYKVDDYKKLAAAWMQQADRNRQQEDYTKALAQYKRAQRYAKKRNDLRTLGIAKLKRAAIHIELSQFEQASQLMQAVAQQERFEPAGLENPLQLIRARLMQKQGKTQQAVAIVKALEAHFIDEPERNIYYRLVRWSYQYSEVPITQIESDLLVLDTLVAQRKLNNIEIYSFALFEYAKWLVTENDTRAPVAIDKAVGHFSSIEITARIRDCYELAAQYYSAQGDRERAEYFEKRVKALK